MGIATFGELWAGYVGLLHQHESHEHMATQIAVGLQGGVSVQSLSRLVCGDGVMVGPRVDHIARSGAGERVAFLYVAPHASLARALSDRLGGQGIAPMDSRLVSCFREHECIQDMVAALCAELGTSADRASLDRRLMRALDVLAEDAGDLGAIERAGAASGLSEARLRALAKSEMGIPLSQWMLWRKLDRGMRSIAAGQGMAVAASHAGFADQAHFARTMKRMFGITLTEATPSLQRSSDSFKTPALPRLIMSGR